MDLQHYLVALRRNIWIIAVGLLLGCAVGGVTYSLTPPSYASTVTFYVSTPMPDGSNPMSAGEFAQDRVNSYLQLLRSERLASLIIKQTDVDLSPREVARSITTSAQAGTVLLTALVTDGSQERAQLIAAGIASNFGSMVDQLDNSGRSDSIVVINTVSGPTDLGKSAPSMKKMIGLGFAAGLVVGIVAALLRELLDTTLRTAEAVVAIAGAPVIGSIFNDPGARRSPLIVGSQANSRRAEAYRQLRTNLQFVGAAQEADVVLVTSSVPGEGKSTTVVNLALSFVEFGSKVLVIDADLRRPRLAGYLSLERNLGLTNVLVGEMEAHQVIQQWGSDELYFLGSGPIPPNPSELLGSERMDELLQGLREEYDKIIIDSPPVLPVTDAAVASALVDGVLVVVRSGKTTRSQLSGTARALGAVNARVLGEVMTMRRSGAAERRQYGPATYYDEASAQKRPTPARVNGNARTATHLSGARRSSSSTQVGSGDGQSSEPDSATASRAK